MMMFIFERGVLVVSAHPLQRAKGIVWRLCLSLLTIFEIIIFEGFGISWINLSRRLELEGLLPCSRGRFLRLHDGQIIVKLAAFPRELLTELIFKNFLDWVESVGVSVVVVVLLIFKRVALVMRLSIFNNINWLVGRGRSHHDLVLVVLTFASLPAWRISSPIFC